MKKFLLLIGAFTLSASFCSATPCGAGTLASYIGLGAGGCTIDGHTLSNFQILPGSTTGTPIAAAGVLVSPLGGPADPGLTVSTNLTAPANAPLELVFTYQIFGASYSASAITLSNSTESGDGGVTEIQNFCAGGAFGPDGFTGCTGVAGSLLTLDGVQQSDQSSFSDVPFVSVTNDFELDGGLAGSASGGTFTNQFVASAAVPEPATWLLAGIGISGIAVLKRRNICIWLEN